MNPENFRNAVLNHLAGQSAIQCGRDVGVSESTGQRRIGSLDELGLTAEQVEKMDEIQQCFEKYQKKAAEDKEKVYLGISFVKIRAFWV